MTEENSLQDVLDGIGSGLYVYGEVLKVWDRTNRTSGEVKYYARLVIDDEPGMIQLNITDLPNGDIRYLAKHLRESALIRCRCFAMNDSAYFKATELVNGAAVASGSALAALLSEDDGEAVT